MQQGAKVAVANDRLEAVRILEKAAELDGGGHRSLGLERAAGDDIREVLAVQILHRHVEVAGFDAVFVDGGNMRAHQAELLLKLGAPLFRLEDVAGFAVRALGHQLERDTPAGARVAGQEHDGHATPANLPENLVRAKPVEYRRHHRPGRGPGGSRGRGSWHGQTCPERSRRAHKPVVTLHRLERVLAQCDERIGRQPWKTLL